MKILLSLIIISMTSGCVFTSYTGKNGVKLTRISVFGNQTVGKVDLEKGTMTGYVSEQAEVAGVVVESAIRGALSLSPK